jgi:DNA-binding HxlR family transcriptional regulator
MKKMTIKKDEDLQCPGDRTAVADYHDALGVLTGKWKGDILWLLAQRQHRFGELRRSIPGITQHMLTAQLRELEADGLVRRTVYAEVPPRVEYEMTESAKALRPVFEELFRWWRQHGPNLRQKIPEAVGR